jgi:hypothetical protein
MLGILAELHRRQIRRIKERENVSRPDGNPEGFRQIEKDDD